MARGKVTRNGYVSALELSQMIGIGKETLRLWHKSGYIPYGIRVGKERALLWQEKEALEIEEYASRQTGRRTDISRSFKPRERHWCARCNEYHVEGYDCWQKEKQE